MKNKLSGLGRIFIILVLRSCLGHQGCSYTEDQERVVAMNIFICCHLFVVVVVCMLLYILLNFVLCCYIASLIISFLQQIIIALLSKNGSSAENHKYCKSGVNSSEIISMQKIFIKYTVLYFFNPIVHGTHFQCFLYNKKFNLLMKAGILYLIRRLKERFFVCFFFLIRITQCSRETF